MSRVQHPDGLRIEAVSESTSAVSDALISSTRWQRGEYIVTGISYRYKNFVSIFHHQKHSIHRKGVFVVNLSPYVTSKHYLAVMDFSSS